MFYMDFKFRGDWRLPTDKQLTCSTILVDAYHMSTFFAAKDKCLKLPPYAKPLYDLR